MEYGIPHEVMDAKEMKDRFKVIKPLDDEVAILEPSAGILLVEDCLRAFVTLAKGLGAQFHFNEPLIKWEANKDGVVAETENGRFSADKIIFSSGAWLPHIVTDLEIPFQCERQVFFWLRPPQNQELFAADNMPVVIWEEESGELNAVTPDLGKGIKISKHHGGDLYSSPEEVRRDVTVQDEFPLRGFLERRMPGANGSTISYTTCLYTNAPDGHFVIDYHPKHRNVIIVSPCSGHGFKFAPVVGEIVSQMVLDGNTVFDISPFSLARFKGKSEQQLLESISKIGLNVYRKH